MSNNATKPLQGYRLGMLRCDPSIETFYKRKGASILSINKAPRSEEAFKRWWCQEVARANQDRMAIVVVHGWPSFQGHKEWLGQLEEEEWFGERSSGAGRVRATNYRYLDRTTHHGESLKDDWNDPIEKGTGAWREEETNGNSESEAEFEG